VNILERNLEHMLNAGAYPGGCPRCPGTSLGQKMSGGEYRAKKLFARVKIFSAGEHLP